MTYHVLYNPHAGNGNGFAQAKKLSAVLTHDTLDFVDVTTIEGYASFIESIPSQDGIILAGGDGTLNRFINACNANNALPKVISREIQYYPAGSDNDFLRDLGIAAPEKPIVINKYLENLPTV